MKLAYFIAIHKAQGSILPVVVIDIGVIEFASGYTYVDVSRVRQSKTSKASEDLNR